MNVMTAYTEFYRSEYEQCKTNLPGHALPWLRRQRDDAMHRLCEHGFPTRHHEDWKYTPVDPLLKKQFSPICTKSNASEITQAQLERLLAKTLSVDSYPLVIWNGRLQLLHGLGETLPSNVICLDLVRALSEQTVQQHFEKIASAHSHSFLELNTAFCQEGVFLHIPAHFYLKKPIHLIHVTTQENLATHSRHVVVADINSQATIIESFIGEDATPYFNNHVTQLYALEGSRLSHYRIQQEGDAAYHLGTCYIDPKAHSAIETYSFSLGSIFARSDIQVHFQAPRASARLFGLYLGAGTQLVDHHTVVHHAVPHCKSEQVYKGILTGKARGVFNGKIKIAPTAQETVAHQQNKNLLLSDTADVNTKPQLEIFTDDVQCTHGATVGQLDKEALFYLRSRGIPAHLAQHLLIQAFCNDILQPIKLFSVKDALEPLLHGYINQMISGIHYE